MGNLVSLTRTALGRARTRASGVACLSHLKQLQFCWQLYVDDFQGRVPPNRSVALYHCPADPSKVLNSHRLRTRSYSRNGNLGGRTNEVQNPVNRYDASPNPAQLFVLIDEVEDSVDDAPYLVWPNPTPAG